MTVDAHQHFWRYNPLRDGWITEEMAVIRRDFLPSDLEPILKANKVEACVAVQADQSEKETEFLLKCARENSFIKGVVGWTDLRSPQLQARLEYYHQFDELKGFRHIVQAEHEDFLLNSHFQNGVAQLEAYGFTYDILVYVEHLPATVTFVRKFPQHKFVIDHIAKPMIKDQITEPWAKYMKEIAKSENVFCKLSGMVTEADWKGWKKEHFSFYLDTILEAFGPERLMYGSDWPVCLVAAQYAQQMDIIQSFISTLSPTEKKDILGENARRFYHL